MVFFLWPIFVNTTACFRFQSQQFTGSLQNQVVQSLWLVFVQHGYFPFASVLTRSAVTTCKQQQEMIGMNAGECNRFGSGSSLSSEVEPLGFIQSSKFLSGVDCVINDDVISYTEEDLLFAGELVSPESERL